MSAIENNLDNLDASRNMTLNRLKAGGNIKAEPEDFIVEEIEKNGVVLNLDKNYSKGDFESTGSEDGDFTNFILQKENWNTIQALIKVAKIFRHGKKSVSFAGTKDRRSISTQMCSIYHVDPESLIKLHVKDLKINGAWKSNEQVRMGDLLGNHFTVKVKNIESFDNIERANDKLNGIFPNYYGGQRFGLHGDNTSIGIDILNGDYESAAMKFLTDTFNERNESAVEARERLNEERDFSKALEYFPNYLKYERMMLSYLSTYPTNYAGALRKLPRTLLLMFLHSVDSYIFNREVEYRVKNGMLEPLDSDFVCGKDEFGYPDMGKLLTYKEYIEGNMEFSYYTVGNIVGYNTEHINEIETDIMDELNIKAEDFKIKSMPELACNGNMRVLFAPYLDFEPSLIDDSTASIKFSLFSGSYATVLLNEFLNVKENESDEGSVGDA